MYQYLKVMKNAYASAKTISECYLLKRTFSASLFTLYNANKITLDMWEFFIIKKLLFMVLLLQYLTAYTTGIKSLCLLISY